MACKSAFALKQLVAENYRLKDEVGLQVIGKMMKDIGDPKLEKGMEYLHHSLLLLQMLATFGGNCLRLDDRGAKQMLLDLKKDKVASKSRQILKQVDGVLESLHDHVDRPPF